MVDKFKVSLIILLSLNDKLYKKTNRMLTYVDKSVEYRSKGVMMR